MPSLNIGDTDRILEVCEDEGLLPNQAAYVLATAYWESARTMEPVREALASSDNNAIAILDRAWRDGQLYWVSEPYWRKDENGDAWFGRGFVQLTHKYNYEKASKKLGVDLVADPHLALDPEIAADILVRGMMEGWFTGHKLPDHVNESKTDFRNARRVVNGTDKASTVAALAEEYLALLESVGWAEKKVPQAAANWKNPDEPPRKSPLKSTTILAAAGGAGGTITSVGAAVGELDGNAQIVAIVCGVVILGAFAWIARERLGLWAKGVR